jgi:hypothetical protein
MMFKLVETRWGMNNYSSDMDGMCKPDQSNWKINNPPHFNGLYLNKMLYLNWMKFTFFFVFFVFFFTSFNIHFCKINKKLYTYLTYPTHIRVCIRVQYVRHTFVLFLFLAFTFWGRLGFSCLFNILITILLTCWRFFS